MFAAIAFYLVYSQSFTPQFHNGGGVSWIVAVTALSLFLVLAAFLLYKRKVEKIRNNPAPLSQKLTAYRAASIIRWAMLEGPVLLNIICFMLTGDYNFLWLTVAILLIFVFTKPSLKIMMQELDLSEDEAGS